MKKIFVRLGRNPHTAYNYIVKFKSKKYFLKFPNYLNNIALKEPKIKIKLKNIFWKSLSKLVLIPKLKVNLNNIDLIHSTNNILLSTSNNWILDTEYFGGLINFNYSKLNEKINYLINIFKSNNFKGIIFWSNAAKKSFTRKIPDLNLKNKLFVLKPCVGVSKKVKQKKKLKKILFIGKNFYEKGGLHVINVFLNLIEKYPFLQLTIVSDLKSIQKDVLSINKGVKFYDFNLSVEDINKLYLDNDLFFFPTFMDTYGMVILEAKAYGLPVITTNCFACPEIITNKKEGFIVKSSFLWHDKDYFFDFSKYSSWDDFSLKSKDYCDNHFDKELFNKIEFLIKNPKQFSKFSKNCIVNSKKSQKVYERKLDFIYLRCLK
ncbi:MAG: glycosyltransferase [Candidatus ainarchaeum sp.]|nr:glycosyltransferase [Candidatus ainarchaeum sp.]